MTTSERGHTLTVRGVRLNPAALTVTVDGHTSRLTGQEFRLLHTLMEQAGHILSVDQLLSAAWDADTSADAGTLKVHVMRLRKKIERDPHVPSYIRTVRGLGYIFDRQPVEA
jgi:DNA-binding response OmpR family regulator